MQKGYGPSPDSMSHHAASAYHHSYYPDLGGHGYGNPKYDPGMYGGGGGGGIGGIGGGGGMGGGGYPHHHQGGNCSPLGGDASVLNSYYHHHQNSCAVQGGGALMGDPNCMVDAGGGPGGGLYDPNGYPAVCGVMQPGMGGLHPGSVMPGKQQHEIYPWMKESRQNNKQRQAQVTGKKTWPWQA
ncbi:hypothetical protein PoB_000533400 [Plakobranchus ocellatus]|uniref:Uncharacterized protein n=1 Tax=Plakobranchus ocellatus TaxID=259542 RepID=A0AAV3Y995_9GAST|nr:hypothetical protein PoB_000533400 [Plakobranchus ocellatus]